MKRFKFVKTFSGMVLYVEHNIVFDYAAKWKLEWRKATESEAQDIMLEITKEQVYKQIVEELKRVNPEIML